MAQWHRNIQDIITIIDDCIRAQQDEALTLRALAQKLGYSEYYTSRKFRELAGMTLRDYLRLRRLAFALRDVRDTDAGILDIAVQYGFSSNEAFTHAFKKAYGVSPSAYRAAPGPVEDAGSGQLMAWINEPTGRICSWGIPLAEAYGVRLSADYAGPVPAQMQLMDVPAGEYLVFEHGPFDFETQNAAVEAKVEQAMRDFDYAASGYRLDLTPGRVFYFYHDCTRFFKYVRPVCRA